VIAAAAHRGEKAHADALRAYGELALVEVPTRGVLAPTEPEVYEAIEAVARDHLGFSTARAAFRRAIRRVEPFDRRDTIENAHNELVSVSDASYFYVGLSFGLTLAELSGHV
jgi:hypothetical protein